MRICISVYVYTCIYVSTSLCLYIPRARTHIHTHARAHTQVSAVLSLVLDIRASKVATSEISGNKRRGRFQRKLKLDLCRLLQCPDHQVLAYACMYVYL